MYIETLQYGGKDIEVHKITKYIILYYGITRIFLEDLEGWVQSETDAGALRSGVKINRNEENIEIGCLEDSEVRFNSIMQKLRMYEQQYCSSSRFSGTETDD